MCRLVNRQKRSLLGNPSRQAGHESHPRRGSIPAQQAEGGRWCFLPNNLSGWGNPFLHLGGGGGLGLDGLMFLPLPPPVPELGAALLNLPPELLGQQLSAKANHVFSQKATLLSTPGALWEDQEPTGPPPPLQQSSEEGLSGVGEEEEVSSPLGYGDVLWSAPICPSSSTHQFHWAFLPSCTIQGGEGEISPPTSPT